MKIHNPTKYPGFRDERNCLVFWARPTEAVKGLVSWLQEEIKGLMPSKIPSLLCCHLQYASCAPCNAKNRCPIFCSLLAVCLRISTHSLSDIWLMPPSNLHMTCLEISHSLTPDAISSLVDTLRPKCQEIADYTYSHRARLIKPMLSYDSAAIALSFVPAAAEVQDTDDEFTYHHLRRDVYNLCKSTGVEIASRYTVPSAHLTIARFVTQKDIIASPSSSSSDMRDNTASDKSFDELDPSYHPSIDTEKVHRLVAKIESLNTWLESNLWPLDSRLHSKSKTDQTEFESVRHRGAEWIVGEGKGLDFRRGTLWYGGGETICLGKGF